MFNISYSPLPIYVQLQLHNQCNLSCPICPYSSNENTNKSLKQEDYNIILNELSNWKHEFTLCLMLQNEPLLDNQLSEKISLARNKLNKNVKISLVTNGSLLTKKLINALFDNGLDTMIISCNSDKISFFNDKKKEKVDIDDFINNLDINRVKGKVVFNTTIYKDNLEKIPRILKTIGKYKSHLAIASDRIKEVKDKYLISNINYHNTCLRPFYSISILSNLDVITCCHDWKHKYVLGNIKNQCIADLWKSERYNKLRNNFIKNNSLPNHCKMCSIPKETYSNVLYPIILQDDSISCAKNILFSTHDNKQLVYLNENNRTYDIGDFDFSNKNHWMELNQFITNDFIESTAIKTSHYYNFNTFIEDNNGDIKPCNLIHVDYKNKTIYIEKEGINVSKTTKVILGFQNILKLEFNGKIISKNDSFYCMRYEGSMSFWKYIERLISDWSISFSEYNKLKTRIKPSS